MRLDEVVTRTSEGTPPLGIAQQRYDRVGKVARAVGGYEVAPRLERQPFGTHRGRHDRLAHGQGLEDLEARAAAGAQRNDVHGGFGNGRPDVIYRSRHIDAGA